MDCCYVQDRHIQVSLADNNYTLSYRRGYFADQPSHEFISEEGADDPFEPLIGLGMPDFDQILFKLQECRRVRSLLPMPRVREITRN